MNFSENSSDGNSSDDDEAADENKPKIDKLRSRAVPIGSKRRELYRDMSAYLRQDTVQNGTDVNDNLRKEELLKNVVDTKTKSSSPNSLSFWKRLIPWNSIIWNVQVRYLKLIFSDFISIFGFNKLCFKKINCLFFVQITGYLWTNGGKLLHDATFDNVSKSTECCTHLLPHYYTTSLR